jgi:hypothetical protein
MGKACGNIHYIHKNVSFPVLTDELYMFGGVDYPF